MQTRSQSIREFYNEVEDLLVDREYKNRCVNDLLAFPTTSKQCLYVLDWKNKECSFQKGVKNFLGYEPEEYTFDFALNNYHPNDIDLIQRIIKAAVNYCISHNVATDDFSLILTYRVKKKDGSYVKVLRQSSMYDTDVNGNMISNFSLLTDISFKDSSERLDWTIHAKNLDEEEFKKNVYSQFQDYFTPREKEIINLIAAKLKNTQIAKELFISVHTVSTHRKNIYRKCNCSGVSNLLEFAHRYGVIG